MKKDSWNVSLFYKFFISYIGIWGHYSQHLYISVLYFFRLLLLRHHIPFMCFGGQLSTPRGRCVYRAVNGDVSTLRGLLQWPEQFPVIRSFGHYVCCVSGASRPLLYYMPLRTRRTAFDVASYTHFRVRSRAWGMGNASLFTGGVD